MIAQVSCGVGENKRTTEVQLNHYTTLTEKSARAVCLVAYGNLIGPYTVRLGDVSLMVWDGNVTIPPISE